jgi:hypothetical protein
MKTADVNNLSPAGDHNSHPGLWNGISRGKQLLQMRETDSSARNDIPSPEKVFFAVKYFFQPQNTTNAGFTSVPFVTRSANGYSKAGRSLPPGF